MDLSSCLELRSSRCVASSASLSNGFTSWENNGRKDGIEKKSKSEENINNGDSVESMSQRSGFNLVGISAKGIAQKYSISILAWNIQHLTIIRKTKKLKYVETVQANLRLINCQF